MTNLQKLRKLSNYLTETESLFSAFWQINPALLVIAKDGKFIKVNPAIKDILGYSQEEFVANPYKFYIHPDDLFITTQKEHELSKNNKVLNFINRYRHKNGYWVDLSWSAWIDMDHGLIFATAVRVKALKDHINKYCINCPYYLELIKKETN